MSANAAIGAAAATAMATVPGAYSSCPLLAQADYMVSIQLKLSLWTHAFSMRLYCMVPGFAWHDQGKSLPSQELAGQQLLS